MTQQQRESQAYADGLATAKAILSGTLGASRDIAPGGAYHRSVAAANAKYLGIDVDDLLQQLIAYHQERLDRAPDPKQYPEAQGEADILRQRYTGMAAAGMDEALVAIVETLAFWQKHVMLHRYGKPANHVAIEAMRERCRVVYMPDSDQGPLHYKNVDDPLISWSPRPPEPKDQPWPYSPLFFDGVGSGLHIDEEPIEIFPLDVKSLCQRHCTTVDEAREFLVRYNHFWESCNLLVHDDQGHSLAFEKAMRNRIAVREPDASGINYINGMSAFDDDYQSRIDALRQKYLQLSGQDDQSVEACYFRFGDGVLRNMKRYMAELAAEPTLAKLSAVMCSRDADGSLCKSGKKVHPDEVGPGATLMQRLYFLRSRMMFVRQWRGDTPVWEDAWEQVQYV